MCFILILLVAAAWIIPYPENISINGVVKGNEKGEYDINVFVPYSLLGSIDVGMPAKIEVEGYPAQGTGYIEASVDLISKNALNFNDKNEFEATLTISRLPDGIRLHGGMQVKVNILVSHESIINRLFHK